MKIKVALIVTSKSVLEAVLQKDMHPVLAFKFARIAEKFSSELEAFAGARNKVIEKHGREDEQLGMVLDDKCEKFEKASEELAALFEEEVEVDIKPISEEDLEKYAVKEIKPAELMALGFLFE